MKFLRPLVLLVLGGSLGAQSEGQARSKLGPRSFFPSEYTSEYFIDLDRIKDTLLWDVFERSAFSGLMRTQFRKSFGFRLDDIVRVRTAERSIVEPDSDPPRSRSMGVTVIEGKRLRLPAVSAVVDGAETKIVAEKIGGYPIVRENYGIHFGSSSGPRLYVMPQPGCLVFGDDELIRSVLLRKRRGGVISSRLMALTAARSPLAYLAIGFPPGDDPRYESEVGLPRALLSDRDPLEHVLARLSVDEKTERVTVQATLRFANGKAGPARMEEGLKAQIETLKGSAGYAMIKSQVEKLRWRRDGVDLHVSLEMTEKELAGFLGPTGIASFFFLSAGQPVVAPQAVAPVPQVAKPKPKPKKQKK